MRCCLNYYIINRRLFQVFENFSSAKHTKAAHNNLTSDERKKAMKKKTSQDGVKIYIPKKALSPQGQTNIITDPAITHGEYTAASDENAALAKKWVDDIEL